MAKLSVLEERPVLGLTQQASEIYPQEAPCTGRLGGELQHFREFPSPESQGSGDPSVWMPLEGQMALGLSPPRQQQHSESLASRRPQNAECRPGQPRGSEQLGRAHGEKPGRDAGLPGRQPACQVETRYAEAQGREQSVMSISKKAPATPRLRKRT